MEIFVHFLRSQANCYPEIPELDFFFFNVQVQCCFLSTEIIRISWDGKLLF